MCTTQMKPAKKPTKAGKKPRPASAAVLMVAASKGEEEAKPVKDAKQRLMGLLVGATRAVDICGWRLVDAMPLAQGAFGVVERVQRAKTVVADGEDQEDGQESDEEPKQEEPMWAMKLVRQYQTERSARPPNGPICYRKSCMRPAASRASRFCSRGMATSAVCPKGWTVVRLRSPRPKGTRTTRRRWTCGTLSWS